MSRVLTLIVAPHIIPPDDLETWIRGEPTGQYARRAAFFYEALTGRRLNLPNIVAGPYVYAVDPKLELTALVPRKNARWRVRDNLLGSDGFSPQVHLTAEVKQALTLDIRERVNALEVQFGADLVMRSAVWLTIKESRASFAIEHEENKPERIKRFAAAIGRYTGTFEDPLGSAGLETVQREILGPDALRYGMRLSAVYVGESGYYGDERVHYIGPHWEQTPSLVAGLREMLLRTVGLSSVARAALLSFGFVYVHPMVDGNGRIGRFLINDVLRRDGALPAPYIVPVSAILQKPDFRPMSYDRALELFSKPFMQGYEGHWRFGADQVGADGVRYNFQFDKYEDAIHAWRYPDLTRHVSFLADALETTIEEEMRGEAKFLQQNSAARKLLKNIIEGPDTELDRIIRSVRSMRGAISGKLASEYPRLADTEVAQQVRQAINDAFPWTPITDNGSADKV